MGYFLELGFPVDKMVLLMVLFWYAFAQFESFRQRR